MHPDNGCLGDAKCSKSQRQPFRKIHLPTKVTDRHTWSVDQDDEQARVPKDHHDVSFRGGRLVRELKLPHEVPHTSLEYECSIRRPPSCR